jgi:predicted nucleic acid-binding protein
MVYRHQLQPNILRLKLIEINAYPDNESRLNCQYRFLEVELSISEYKHGHENMDLNWSIYKELLMPLGTASNLTSDAHLAALTIEHGARLYSTDNDFSRFKSLRWTNPVE